MNHKIRFAYVFAILFIVYITPAKTSAGKSVPIKEEKIQSGDMTLFIRTVGNSASSPILIAINGGPGMSSHYLKSMEQLASPDLTIVTYDQRGTGRSSESAAGYSMQKHVADIDNIRQHLKAKKIYLFGHSFGGILAQLYASLHPERVLALILMGSGPPTFSAASAAQSKFNQRIQQLVQEGIISGPQPTDPAKMLEYLLPAYFSDPKFSIPKEIKESSLHISAIQETYSDSGEWDFREGLKVITCPVLFIWGEDDPFGIETAEATQKALINAKLIPVTLNKCGHYWQENEEDFFIQIKNFLLADIIPLSGDIPKEIPDDKEIHTVPKN